MNKQMTVLAGGCFWGVEEILRTVPGVLSTEVGYCGGHTQNPTYKQICTGETGHAEAIQIEFDSDVLPFSDLLEKWFFRLHDPTTLNRQGNDVGTQYRSVIFYRSEEERQVALKSIEKAQIFWKKEVVTQVEKLDRFYPAEDYHQDYLQKNPSGYTCHYLR